MQSQSELKSLNTQRQKVQEQIAENKRQAKDLQQSINDLVSKDKALEQKIQNLKDKDIVITEHAILRYLERSMKLNIDDVKKAILPDVVKKQIEILGDGLFPIPDGGGKLRVKNRTIVTIVE